MITPRSTKKINSYKEERIRSARKGLSESISFGKDLEELESVMKLSISRRSSGGLNTMRLSLQRELSESFSLKSPSNLESSLRLSNVNDKFISKYMDKASNIIEVSEEEPVSNVLAEKSVSSNILLKPKKKVVEALRKDPKLEKCLPSSVKVLGKMTESRLIQKAIKKRASKAEVGKTIKKVEALEEQIQKLQVGCGSQISHYLQIVINKLRQEC